MKLLQIASEYADKVSARYPLENFNMENHRPSYSNNFLQLSQNIFNESKNESIFTHFHVMKVFDHAALLT